MEREAAKSRRRFWAYKKGAFVVAVAAAAAVFGCFFSSVRSVFHLFFCHEKCAEWAKSNNSLVSCWNLCSLIYINLAETHWNTGETERTSRNLWGARHFDPENRRLTAFYARFFHLFLPFCPILSLSLCLAIWHFCFESAVPIRVPRILSTMYSAYAVVHLHRRENDRQII